MFSTNSAGFVLNAALKSLVPNPGEIITAAEGQEDEPTSVFIYGSNEYWLQVLGTAESEFRVFAWLNNFPEKNEDLYEALGLSLPDAGVAITEAITTIRKHASTT